MQWTRSGYDTTLIQCSGAGLPREVWYGKVVSLIQNLEVADGPQIDDNGFRRFPGVLVTEGVKGAFRGHPFSIWSDHPGEILLMHRAVPRWAVELLCSGISECWHAVHGAL